MLTLIYGLLCAPYAYAECGCVKKEKTHEKKQQAHHKDNLKKMHHFSVIVDKTTNCKGHQKLSGKEANAFVGMLLHNTGMKDNAYVCSAKVHTEDGKTFISGKVPDQYKEAEIEKKVKEGFEKLCQQEKEYEKKPVAERKEGSCWVCHKLVEFKEWWQSLRAEQRKNEKSSEKRKSEGHHDEAPSAKKKRQG